MANVILGTTHWPAIQESRKVKHLSIARMGVDPQFSVL